MAKASRDKGTRGEIEVAAIFRAAGFDCDRTPNSGGLRILGDLYGSTPAHVEVKRQEVARPWAWFEQAEREATAGAAPVVAFRRNRSPWLAIARLEELARLFRIEQETRELLDLVITSSAFLADDALANAARDLHALVTPAGERLPAAGDGSTLDA